MGDEADPRGEEKKNGEKIPKLLEKTAAGFPPVWRLKGVATDVLQTFPYLSFIQSPRPAVQDGKDLLRRNLMDLSRLPVHILR